MRFLLGPERVESKVMSWVGDGAQGLRSCLATRFQPSTTRGGEELMNRRRKRKGVSSLFFSYRD